MKYVIEVRRPSTVTTKKFASLLNEHFKFIKGYPGCQFEIFETEADRHRALSEIPADETIRVLTIDPTNCLSDVRYIGIDADADNDAYFVSIDIPDEYIDEMNRGKGQFVPRVVYDTSKKSSSDDGQTNQVPYFIVALDYVKKGGQ